MKWNIIFIGGFLLPLSSITVAKQENVLQLCMGLVEKNERLECFEGIAGQQLASRTEVNVLQDEPILISSQNEVDSLSANDSSVQQPYQFKKHNDTLDVSQVHQSYSLLSERYDLEGRGDSDDLLSLRPYKPVYILPVMYNRKLNERPESPTERQVQQFTKKTDHTEASFQLSFKVKLAEDLFKTKTDVWFGYTQLSQWQIYNRTSSSPFRNTDYEPELFITRPMDVELPFNGRLRLLGVSLNHQSNGQSRPLSRSWNRMIGFAGMEWGSLTVMPRIWSRLKTEKHNNNPDITDYLGHGELLVDYRFANQHSLSSVMRLNTKTKKGGVGLNYNFPITKKLRGTIQAYDGYGMNLLDYNHSNRSIGIGFMLND